MNYADFNAVTYDGDIYCVGCLPDEVSLDHEEVSPIFAGSEWEYIPVCGHCGHEHDYICLLPPMIEQTTLVTWFERDRAHVCLLDNRTNEELLDLWDEEVTEAVEDGFLKMSRLHETAYEMSRRR